MLAEKLADKYGSDWHKRFAVVICIQGCSKTVMLKEHNPNPGTLVHQPLDFCTLCYGYHRWYVITLENSTVGEEIDALSRRDRRPVAVPFERMFRKICTFFESDSVAAVDMPF